MTVEGENPRLAFDIPIVEYALFNIKRFALFLAKKGMKMFEMVIGVRRRTIKWIRCGGDVVCGVDRYPEMKGMSRGGRLRGSGMEEARRSVEWTGIRR